MRTLLARATLSAIVLLVGCTPTAPAPGPTSPAAPPTQSYYCTPDGETSGAPCSKEEYDAQLERDRLYEEAESVYRKLTAAEQELFRHGAPADESVLRYVTGQARDTVVQAHESELRLVDGEARIVWIKRNPDEAKAESTVSMVACIDNTAALSAMPGEAARPGGHAREYMFFVNSGDGLKVTLFEYEVVDAC